MYSCEWELSLRCEEPGREEIDFSLSQYSGPIDFNRREVLGVISFQKGFKCAGQTVPLIHESLDDHIYLFRTLCALHLRALFCSITKREEGFSFVMVELDGSVRELNDDEKEYLNTEFEPGDSGRPYVKSRYGSLTPDGKIHGFVERRRVPFWIKIMDK